MDPRFVSSAPDSQIAEALGLWPELAGRRIRPLLVTALGSVFVEFDTGEVLVADPVELRCEQVATSVEELQQLFSDREWSATALLPDLLLMADGNGVTREPHQVFALAPHPCFTGNITMGNLKPMDLSMWHHICAQLRERRR